jgi:hypothetical protein
MKPRGGTGLHGREGTREECGSPSGFYTWQMAPVETLTDIKADRRKSRSSPRQGLPKSRHMSELKDAPRPTPCERGIEDALSFDQAGECEKPATNLLEAIS